MSTSTRRSFLGSVAAAAALPLIPETAKASPTPTPSTIPLWLLEDQSKQGWDRIQGHYPSQLHAKRSYALTCKPKGTYTLRPVACPTSGRVFRVIETEWNAYELLVDRLTAYKTGRDPFFPKADFPERLRDALADTGLPKARVLADMQKCVAAGRNWASRAPRHLLDVPDVLVVGMTEQTADEPEYTDRVRAMREAAACNREQFVEGEVPEDWCIVVEVGEPIEQVAYADLDFSGEIGVEQRATFRPVRLVRPTEEEIAQYGQAVAGGAS